MAGSSRSPAARTDGSSDRSRRCSGKSRSQLSPAPGVSFKLIPFFVDEKS
jgi:hypothetical protein